jgi:hypothetical protein
MVEKTNVDDVDEVPEEEEHVDEMLLKQKSVDTRWAQRTAQKPRDSIKLKPIKVES